MTQGTGIHPMSPSSEFSIGAIAARPFAIFSKKPKLSDVDSIGPRQHRPGVRRLDCRGKCLLVRVGENIRYRLCFRKAIDTLARRILTDIDDGRHGRLNT
jgi:hypothetical protein